MLIFNFYYKTAAGHGLRGSDIEAETIEEAFEIAKKNNEIIWNKAKDKEFYVTPAKIKTGNKIKQRRTRGQLKDEYVYPDKYPQFTTYGIGGTPWKSNKIEYYESKYLKNK